MKIVLTGGGTAGHINPAIAIKNEFRRQYPNTEFYYFGKKDGLESDIVKRDESIKYYELEVLGLSRKNIFKNFKVAYLFYKSYRYSKKVLKKIQPTLVIGTGGYVSCPVVYAATKLKIPTMIHEQNAIVGLTNKLLGKRVDKVAVSFPDTVKNFPKGKSVLTGNPCASEMMNKNGQLDFYMPFNMKKVLVFGGSLGAKKINEIIISLQNKLADQNLFIILISGKKAYLEIKKQIHKNNILVKDYIYNMPVLMKSVDLIISRAGATSIAEILAIKKPLILIPSPNVTKNHQEINANYLESLSACITILEKDLTEEKLSENINKLLTDNNCIKDMIEAQERLKMADGSKSFVREALKII